MSRLPPNRTWFITEHIFVYALLKCIARGQVMMICLEIVGAVNIQQFPTPSPAETCESQE